MTAFSSRLVAQFYGCTPVHVVYTCTMIYGASLASVEVWRMKLMKKMCNITGLEISKDISKRQSMSS
jgi:hypothetical protein